MTFNSTLKMISKHAQDSTIVVHQTTKENNTTNFAEAANLSFAEAANISFAEAANLSFADNNS